MTLNPKLHFVALDSFGTEVFRYLKVPTSHDPDFVQLASGERLHIDPEANSSDLYVPIAGTTIRALCLELDAQAHDCDSQFMPVAIESSFLLIGPRIVPNQTPCWECWDERLTSQHPLPDDRSALLAAHDLQPQALGPGFMPFIASLAACQIVETLEVPRDITLGFGRLWKMNIFTREVSTSMYTGRHRCPKCSPISSPQDRSIGSLRSYLNQANR